MDSSGSSPSFVPEESEFDEQAPAPQVRFRQLPVPPLPMRLPADSDFDDDEFDSSDEIYDLRLPGQPNQEGRGTRLAHYLPLYMAASIGDWEAASQFIEQEPDAVRARVTEAGETALIVVINNVCGSYFVEKLVEKMSVEDVALANSTRGFTSLHRAAANGNIAAARLLVAKNPDLPNIADKRRHTPLNSAAFNGNREMVLYLLQVTREDIDPKPFEDVQGVDLLCKLVKNELYDIAVELLQRYPHLAILEPSPLMAIAQKPSSFRRRTSSNFWQNLIYSGAPLILEYDECHRTPGDVENPTDPIISVKGTWPAKFWKVAEIFVPPMKHIREQKLMHHQALQLVKCLCTEVAKSDFSKANKIFKTVLFEATTAGIHEVVEEILRTYPYALVFKNQRGHDVFQHAIVSRRENVFNLIYQHGVSGDRISLALRDTLQNNTLHLAASLPLPKQPYFNPSPSIAAALAMQREWQWFKEVEKFVVPQAKEERNCMGRTPAETFTDVHKELMKAGERWMKDTANTCTIVAALIAATAFAAAATSRGNNSINDNLISHPKRKALTIFGVSDSISLFSSITSLFAFLSILTSRFDESDFPYAVPSRLIIGLLTLLLSIISLVVAFGSTLFLVFGHEKEWVLTLLIALAGLTVTIFPTLQFPISVEMIKSTYGKGLFGKQSERLIF